MADAPLAAVGISEQARGREEEPAPAPHPQARIVAIDLAERDLDLVAMRIEPREPVLRGALVMRAAPAPFLLDRKRSEEHTSELQSPYDLVCRLLLEKKNIKKDR